MSGHLRSHQLEHHKDLAILWISVVLTLDCLEHTHNYQQAFLEIHQLLKLSC